MHARSLWVAAFVCAAAGCGPAELSELPGEALETTGIEETLIEVPERLAQCEGTSGRPLTGGRGCSGLDVAQTPELFLEAPRLALDTALKDLSRRAELKDAGTIARSAFASLDRAAQLLPKAKLCEGAKEVSAAADTLARSATLTRSALNAHQAKPTSRAEAALGDFGPRDATFVDLRIALRRLEKAEKEVRASGALFSEACAQVRGLERVTVKVARVDDRRGRLVLEDGTVVAFDRGAVAGATLHSGATLDLSLRRMGDGTAVLDTVHQSGPVVVGLNQSCLDWRVAPVQPYPQLNVPGSFGRAGLPATPNWQAALLDPAGYTSVVLIAERFALEAGMGIGVKRRLCQLTMLDTPYNNHRISAKVELVDTYGNKTVLASQLDEDDWPVALPALNVPTSELVITTYSQECTHPQPPPCKDNICPIYPNWDEIQGIPPCGPKTQIEKKTYPLMLMPRGFYCSANYDATTFAIEDDDRTAVATARVNSISLNSASGIETATFFADAYAATAPTWGNDNRYHATLMQVQGSQPFGIFSFEPCVQDPQLGRSNCAPNPNGSYWLAAAGTNGAVGIRWPRAVGTNSITGKKFAFSCRTPERLIRDQLNSCSGNGGFYRLPFADGTINSVGQGNCHCAAGGTCTHMCGGAQEFAYDFPHASGTAIRAARGGRVVDVYMDQTQNCWNTTWCPGNHIIIEHQDGRYGFYTHMPPNSSYVTEGQYVLRGKRISSVGNTGNSSNAHLHFHVTDDVGGYGQTFLAQFQLYLNAPSSDYRTCRVPDSNTDDLGSNNSLPLYTP